MSIVSALKWLVAARERRVHDNEVEGFVRDLSSATNRRCGFLARMLPVRLFGVVCVVEGHRTIRRSAVTQGNLIRDAEVSTGVRRAMAVEVGLRRIAPTLGCAPARVEPVMWTADGITSQPYSTSSIIARCSFAGSPPVALVARRYLLVNRRQQRASAACEVTDSQLAYRLAHRDQSTPSILATASRASRAADAGSV